MEEKSTIKKNMFKQFITDNEDLIKNHLADAEPDKEKNTIANSAEFKKELRKLMDSFQEVNKQKFKGNIFNKTDHYRVPIIYKFYNQYEQYWKVFTIGEMDFLGIFLNTNKDENAFKNLADKYLKYLESNDNKNSLAHLKGLIGLYSKPELTEDTKTKIKELAALTKKKNHDIIEIKKEIAYICRDLKITGEFITYCNKKKH